VSFVNESVFLLVIDTFSLCLFAQFDTQILFVKLHSLLSVRKAILRAIEASDIPEFLI